MWNGAHCINDPRSTSEQSITAKGVRLIVMITLRDTEMKPSSHLSSALEQTQSMRERGMGHSTQMMMTSEQNTTAMG